ncbi:MAG: AAA family ATPase [Sulfuriferula sp.]|nr:AAA family ATPase [Sulfuriferula sp.]
MIEKIQIRNFKSIGSLVLNLSKFNCFIGMNGAGKSTILQGIDFISQLMTGNVQDWLDSRGWVVQELNCKLIKDSNIVLGVKYRTQAGLLLTWLASFNRHDLRCSSEKITLNKEIIFSSSGQEYRIEGRKQPISFTYQGSIFSQLKDSELPLPILELRNELRRIRSLELLSPHLLRKRARAEDHDIGAGGEKLSGYLHNIKGGAKEHLLVLLKVFYPNLIDFKVASMRAGWKKLMVLEQFGEQKLETEATHLSDGLLRILAVLAQAESDHPLVLLDEIENGINPEIIEKLVDMLVKTPQQIIVTTHSPMILNYLDDDVARVAVQYIYKNTVGLTRIRRFFEMENVGKKLEVMGAGEAFIDTDLVKLTEECIALDEQDALVEKQRAEAEAKA